MYRVANRSPDRPSRPQQNMPYDALTPPASRGRRRRMGVTLMCAWLVTRYHTGSEYGVVATRAGPWRGRCAVRRHSACVILQKRVGEAAGGERVTLPWGRARAWRCRVPGRRGLALPWLTCGWDECSASCHGLTAHACCCCWGCIGALGGRTRGGASRGCCNVRRPGPIVVVGDIFGSNVYRVHGADPVAGCRSGCPRRKSRHSTPVLVSERGPTGGGAHWGHSPLHS